MKKSNLVGVARPTTPYDFSASYPSPFSFPPPPGAIHTRSKTTASGSIEEEEKMRCTRLKRMYLPRRPKGDENSSPIQVQNSRSFLRAIAFGAVLAIFGSTLLALRKLQQRKREDSNLYRQRQGQRVVIVGGGTGGCAAAALLARRLPTLRITVIEKEKQHVFQGHVPLAHVGHRSYDVCTTTGFDLLHSPASWNITRDANLVAAEVLRVDPARKTVYVRTTPSMRIAAKSVHNDDEAPQGPIARLVARCWPHHRNGARTLSVNYDGSVNFADGTTAISYDALIIAAGATRSLGSLKGLIHPQQLDNYRIAVNTGTTRDNLATLFSGNVLHVKVPPASFVYQMEAARRACSTLQQASLDDPVPPLTLGVRKDIHASVTTTPYPSSQTAAEGTSSFFDLVTTLSTMASHFLSGMSDTPASSPLTDEVAQALAAPPVGAPALAALSSWCMHFSSRQHDGTFVSSVNTVWRYLYFFHKLGLCHHIAATADLHPIGAAPPPVNRVIECLWRERQLACQALPHAGVPHECFHPLFHCYLTQVDTNANVATLYDYKNAVELRVPYHLLLLDLPLCAPSFVRESGLHRRSYVEECALPALRCGIEAAVNAIADDRKATAAQLRRLAPAGSATKQWDAFFHDEASFVDVHPETLQHRHYADIFALGDVAGLPTVKSYGAVYAQVPVVVHNVQQVLEAQQCEDISRTVVPPTSSSAEPGSQALRSVANATYTGYSSFHIVMSTWRAMWPELCYNAPQSQLRCVHAGSADLAAAARKRALDVVEPLTHCNQHWWDNLAWRDPRGFLNGLYHQSSLYELMYCTLFHRGLWHSPTWFDVPMFSVEDGSPLSSRWFQLV